MMNDDDVDACMRRVSHTLPSGRWNYAAYSSVLLPAVLIQSLPRIPPGQVVGYVL